MKKALFVFLLGFVCTGMAWSNPLPVYPFSFISEFMYDENGHWVLELELEHVFHLDSMFICSSSVKSKVDTVLVDDFGGYLVLREHDGTTAPLNINSAGDSLTLVVYDGYERALYCSLVFGNYRNSEVGSPGKGQSIVMVERGYIYTWDSRVVPAKYAKCSQPSIGDYNDINFTQGTMKGKVYKSGVPYIDDKEFTLYNGDAFCIDAEGNYETRLYANIATYDTIYTGRDSWTKKFHFGAPIKEITPTIEPNAITEQDIYILSDFIVTNIKQTKAEKASVLILYPNPATEKINFEVNTPVVTTNSLIEFVNSVGQIVFQYLVKDKKGTIDLPTGLDNGMYIVNLVVNGKKYESVKVMISR